MRGTRAFLTAVVVAAAVVASATSVAAQTGRIGGTVKDDKGQPINGATVIAENPQASPSSFTATTDDKAFVRLGQDPFPADQEFWNNPGDTAAAGENRAGNRAHETVGAAAKNEAYPGLCHGLAELSRGRFIDGVGALGGAAIHTNVADEVGASLEGDVLQRHDLLVARRL